MKIALSKGSGSERYALYTTWLRTADPEVQTVDLHGMSHSAAVEALQECNGIVFTGGADVVPERYGRQADFHRCHVDAERDEVEFALVHAARERSLPILGICRGAQLLNVAFGGTLIVDIPTDAPSSIEHRSHDGVDGRHDLEVDLDSILRKICRSSEGVVNSAHHQAVDVLADIFSISARASDGIIEAYESTPKHGQSMVVAVQWHPERLEYENPFSLPIAQHFVFECHSYHQLIRK